LTAILIAFVGWRRFYSYFLFAECRNIVKNSRTEPPADTGSSKRQTAIYL
jgi:hypothetical protein